MTTKRRRDRNVSNPAQIQSPQFRYHQIGIGRAVGCSGGEGYKGIRRSSLRAEAGDGVRETNNRE